MTDIGRITPQAADTQILLQLWKKRHSNILLFNLTDREHLETFSSEKSKLVYCIKQGGNLNEEHTAVQL